MDSCIPGPGPFPRDLHPINILVNLDGEGEGRVLALIDFEQSGWYLEQWEYCKARWTAEIGGEWETQYLPMILKRHEDAYYHWEYFCLSLGV